MVRGEEKIRHYEGFDSSGFLKKFKVNSSITQVNPPLKGIKTVKDAMNEII